MFRRTSLILDSRNTADKMQVTGDGMKLFVGVGIN